jgi:internalin A
MKKIYLNKNIFIATFCLICSLPLLFNNYAESQAHDMDSFKTFIDWCENRDSLNEDIKYTIEQMLVEAKTSDCKLANQKLLQEGGLSLNKRRISNLLPIGSLTNLKFLGLENNNINDISPLSCLTNLTRLSLTANHIADIKPLEKLTKITELGIGHNQISDITPLKNMRNLKRLSARNNQISDVTPLKSLTKLQLLFLNNNKITDISSLRSLINVRVVSFRGNPIINKICPFININYEDKIGGNPCLF